MNKAIEVKNLSYIYPDANVALRDISFVVAEGESLGIIGPNGAGKSTLLLHLNGILISDGCVRVFNNLVNEKSLKEIRRDVGLVFQDPDNQLFMPTVFDDVAFGPVNLGFKRGQVESVVYEALRQVDMLDALKKMSHHLSFGEKKRISIATVLSMNPKILVLDEPTSNLDPKHRRDLINLLNRLKLSKIIATHDLELVLETCPKTALLDKGRIIAIGQSLDILSNKSLLESHSLEIPPSLK